MVHYSLEPNLSLLERLRWLIRLRWIAVAGVVLTVWISVGILGISVLPGPLYGTAVFLGFYNLLFLVLVRRASGEPDTEPGKTFNRLANAQISLDLMTLAVLIHFSGGIENPFLFYFIFHTIIASILLTRKESFLQATFAIALVVSVIFLESLGVLQHHNLRGFAPPELYKNSLYILGVSFVFVSTLFIAVYMATSISARLKERELNLRHTNEQLQDKDRIKSEYVLRVTHDIKGHLSAIQSCVEPVISGLTGGLNEVQKRLLTRVTRRAERLQYFVETLLQITRLKLAGEPRKEPISLRRIVEETCKTLRPGAISRNLHLEVSLPERLEAVLGDADLIQESFTRALSNAVKYTPPGGNIQVRLWAESSQAILEIKDTGIGIPEEAIPCVFEEFYRADNARTYTREGSGLGLSLSKMIIDLFQGRLDILSTVGKGTTVRITFPIQKPGEPSLRSKET